MCGIIINIIIQRRAFSRYIFVCHARSGAFCGGQGPSRITVTAALETDYKHTHTYTHKTAEGWVRLVLVSRAF